VRELLHVSGGTRLSYRAGGIWHEMHAHTIVTVQAGERFRRG
jgi:hypothetical protein